MNVLEAQSRSAVIPFFQEKERRALYQDLSRMGPPSSTQADHYDIQSDSKEHAKDLWIHNYSEVILSSHAL